jgi:hypothetical protein
MAIDKQINTHTRPTPEQTQEARTSVLQFLTAREERPYAGILPSEVDAIRVLHAATAPHTDEEIARAIVEAGNRLHPRASSFEYRVQFTIEALRMSDAWTNDAYVARVVRHFFGPVKL